MPTLLFILLPTVTIFSFPIPTPPVLCHSFSFLAIFPLDGQADCRYNACVGLITDLELLPTELPLKAFGGFSRYMMAEFQNKRVIAFVDGQNLFNAAKQAFGYDYPNYDTVKLAQLVCEQRGQAQQELWTLVKLHFYTGMPSPTKDEPRNRFWKTKLSAMGRNEIVQTFSRPLVYRNGIGQEKGIDVRLALDAVRLAHESAYDVVLIFSQDQDFSELAIEIKRIAEVQGRWVTVSCAYPVGAGYSNKSGIDKTDWFKIDKTLYDEAIDHYNHRKPVE